MCREFAVPAKSSYARLKKLARYLIGLPRLVYKYDFQSQPSHITVYFDTDIAGCQSTRRSKSGGVCLNASHSIKHWSKTQATVCLSSGEAELRGIGHGLAEALGIQPIARDLGLHWEVHLHSDATAAIGIARRTGMGKIRHLDCSDLWVQEKIRTEKIQLVKIAGAEKPTDAFTKHVPREILEKSMNNIGMVSLTGRPACAPETMGLH